MGRLRGPGGLGGAPRRWERAAAANHIMIPDIDVPLETVCESLRSRRERGKDSSVIVVSEGAKFPDVDVEQTDSSTDAFGHVRLDRRNVGETVAREIEKRTGF